MLWCDGSDSFTRKESYLKILNYRLDFFMKEYVGLTGCRVVGQDSLEGFFLDVVTNSERGSD